VQWLLWGVLGTAVAACAADDLLPLGHVLLYVDTDAPLPAAAGEPPADPPALFDRLRLQVFPPGSDKACAGCDRTFGVDSRMLSQGKASMAIIPGSSTQGARVRVQLYRSAGTTSLAPRPRSTVEKVVLLPEVPAYGVVELSATLLTETVGHPIGDLDDPRPADRGRPSPSLVGSWQGARRVPCRNTAQVGEACVAGGAYWMGDARLNVGDEAGVGGELERLVVLSPFFIDTTEVTVAAFRASGLARRKSPGGPSVDPAEGGKKGTWCTFTSEPSANDPLPLNCVSWGVAQSYCRSLGRTLPSEAQFELVASARQGSAYVWGSDPPECKYAVFARGSELDACAAFGLGPAPPGSGSRDGLRLGDTKIVDLAGNLAEWALDFWNRDREPCWTPTLLFDPLCGEQSPQDGEGHGVRGGHFADWLPAQLQAAWRRWSSGDDAGLASEVGFRCARPDGEE
jgi:formylglycine-generating enzyme required for sulfatase activity